MVSIPPPPSGPSPMVSIPPPPSGPSPMYTQHQSLFILCTYSTILCASLRTELQRNFAKTNYRYLIKKQNMLFISFFLKKQFHSVYFFRTGTGTQEISIFYQIFIIFLVLNPFLPGSGFVSFMPGSGSVSKFGLDPDP